MVFAIARRGEGKQGENVKFHRMAAFAAAFGAAMCTAIGAAGPASADPVDGTYDATMIGGNNDKQVGQTVSWSLTGCGPDCFQLGTGGPGVTLYREGPFWKGTGGDGCTWSMMNDSLYINAECPGGATFVIGMQKV